jgi:hypothetical protein
MAGQDRLDAIFSSSHLLVMKSKAHSHGSQSPAPPYE